MTGLAAGLLYPPKRHLGNVPFLVDYSQYYVYYSGTNNIPYVVMNITPFRKIFKKNTEKREGSAIEMKKSRLITRSFDIELRKLAQDPRRVYECRPVSTAQLTPIKAVKLG